MKIKIPVFGRNQFTAQPDNPIEHNLYPRNQLIFSNVFFQGAANSSVNLQLTGLNVRRKRQEVSRLMRRDNSVDVLHLWLNLGEKVGSQSISPLASPPQRKPRPGSAHTDTHGHTHTHQLAATFVGNNANKRG